MNNETLPAVKEKVTLNQKDATKMLDFEDVIPELGGCGRYQYLLSFFMSLTIVVTTFPAFNQIFMVAQPDHWCRVRALENTTLSLEQKKSLSIPQEYKDKKLVYSNCEMYDIAYTDVLRDITEKGNPVKGNKYWPKSKCKDGWEFDKTWYDRTIATQWELVCHKQWLGSLSMSMFSAGGIIGTFVFGWIGDRFGRRIGFFTCWATQLIFGVATAFSPEFISFCVFRFFVGATIPPIYMSPFLLSVEITPPNKHSMISGLIWVFFAIGYMLLPLIAWATYDWKWTALATSAPLAAFIIYWWFMPESPRWLLTHDKKPLADNILRHVAKINKKPVPEDLLEQLRVPVKEKEGKKETANLLEIFRYSYLKKKYLVVLFVWITNQLVYIGLSYSSGLFIGDNIYLTFFYSGCAEAIAYTISWPLMQTFGRRIPVCFAMLITAASCFLTIAVPPGYVGASVFLAMVAKLMITASFTIIYLLAAEIVPTTLRSTCMGTCALCGNCLLMIVPQIVFLSTYSESIPMSIFAIVAVVGGIAVLYLPETLNEHLAETPAEADLFGKEQRWYTFVFNWKGHIHKWPKPTPSKTFLPHKQTTEAAELQPIKT